MVTENNYLKIYRDAVLDLAETIVIKSDYSARRINQLLAITHPGTFTDDPRTWKYYLNLSGEYHASDTEMVVVSLDTLKPIVFNKANLSLHKATARAYGYNTRLYRELVVKYPMQESLILGILHPADMETVLAADEFSIVSYPDYLVEHNELTLIYDLDKWVKAFIGRWRNGAYNISDDLFEASVFGVLATKLPEAIMTLRLKRMKSDEVHSFFVTLYLASNGRLDRYLEVLTHKQKLWLYRNLPWVRRNVGRQESYNWLIENMLTERYVPLMAYAMKHDPEKVTEEIVPQARFKPTAKNRYVSEADVFDRTLTDVLYMEDALASGNIREREANYEKIDSSLRHSLSHRVSTKVLQSIMTDFAGSESYPFEDILVNHWVYLSHLGIFSSYVQIVNPRTGVQNPLPAKDAFIMALYLLLKIQGFEPTIIPPITVTRVQRILRPDISELREVVDTSKVSDAELQAFISIQPSMIPIISIDAFNEKCYEIFLANQFQEYYTANSHHKDRRAYLKNAAALLYGTLECVLTEGAEKSFSVWFENRQIEIEDYLEDPAETYKNIVEEALGLNLTTTTTVSDIQAGMLNILGQHSSYSIQLIRSINDSKVKPIGESDERFGDYDMKGYGELGQIDGVVDPEEIIGLGRHEVHDDEWLDVDIVDVPATFKDILCIDLQDPIDLDSKGTKQTYQLDITMSVLPDVVLTEPTSSMVPVPGTDLYDQLTDEQKRNVPDVMLELFS